MEKKYTPYSKHFYKKTIAEPITRQNVKEISNEEKIIERKSIKKTPNIHRITKRIKPLPMKIPDKPKNNTSYAHIGKIDPIYKGKIIYIIGGGPSLTGFDFKRLNNKIVIAVNKAFLFYPEANVLYWTDSRFYEWYQKEIDDFKGIKVTNKTKPVKENIINLHDTGREGLDISPYAIKHGNNSGYAAMNLAYHLGAKTIVLLGFDMKIQGNKTHWHDGYQIKQNGSVYQNNMLPCFDSIVEPLKKFGVEVYNACPTSALNCFQKCSIEHALNLV